MNTSIWKWRNTAHITKMGIEGTAALASLAAAITTVLIATNIVAVPESLAFISTIINPIGIAALFVAAVYFAAKAISSYQQMCVTKGEKGDPGPKGEKGETLSKDTLKAELTSVLQEPSVVEALKKKVPEKV